MDIHKGSDRLAVVGKNYTVKFPLISLANFLQYANDIAKHRGTKSVLETWQKGDKDGYGSLKYMLLHGIMANRREARISKSGAVTPTKSILGGMANIQRTAQPSNVRFEEIWSAFVDVLGSRATELGHMIEDPNNLGLIDGHMKFVDGGSAKLERLLELQPESIHQALGLLTVRTSTATQLDT